MAKNDNQLIGIILVIGLIGIFAFGGNAGWFKGGNIVQPPEDLTPTPNQPTYSICSQVCSSMSFSKSYSLIDNCKAGETKITYGYPNQAPLLICCCYNEPASSTCIDSDGDNRDTVGHVTYAGDTFYDKCLAVGQGVTEYICLNGVATTKNWACDLGETCVQTRSGGHCVTSAPTWHAGDTVFQGSGSGSITGEEEVFGELDLSDYGITTDGNCRLGALIQTDWSYGNDFCMGIQGMESILWEFFDSNGLEYSRIDAVPVGLGVDLHPEEHILEWDGQTHWMGLMTKRLGLQNCVINYNYNIKIYIYDCL
jgi:hypothetical protein